MTSLPLDLPERRAFPQQPPAGIAHPDSDRGERRGVLELIEDHARHHVVLTINGTEVFRVGAGEAQRLASMLFWAGQRVGDYKRAMNEKRRAGNATLTPPPTADPLER